MFYRSSHNTGIDQTGFTLIETLVAVAILATAVAGPLTLASKSLSTAIISKDQVIAYNLAQEGIDYLRSERDDNYLQGNSWLSGDISQCVSSTGSQLCRVDARTNSIDTCSGSSCPPLEYDASTNFYTYSGGTDTSFVRNISIEQLNGHEVAITAEVKWQSPIGERSIRVRENLFDWF